MKTLMKSISLNYELKVDEIFSSTKNKKIMNKLVPELLKLMVSRFNSIRKQLHE